MLKRSVRRFARQLLGAGLANKPFNKIVRRVNTAAIAFEPCSLARIKYQPPTPVNPACKIPTPFRVATDQRDDIVFVTARFRSGSTALWNAFRQLPECTAYYEPFNERRFFDESCRGLHVDRSHLGVEDYSAEYNGIVGLDTLWDDDWPVHRLYLDEDAWEPEMKLYIERLIEGAAGRPILQFNRVDFRLPWLRRQFPNARIVHLQREPREQWCSMIAPSIDRDQHMDTFSDGFYLRFWERDLRHVMPVLAKETLTHPYELAYLIQRLSELFAVHYADISVQLEPMLQQPLVELTGLADTLNLDKASIDIMASTFQPNREPRWPQYADDEWFSALEERCEERLRNFLCETKRDSHE